MRALASWSRFALLLAATPACVVDDGTVEPFDEAAQQLADAGAPDAAAPDVAAKDLPDCTRYLATQRWVFGYAHPAELRAAAASRDGYVVLAFAGLDIPVLKLARTPDLRPETNLHTLFPEDLRTVFALSEIRGDRLLVVHGDSHDRAPRIASIDLHTRTLRWSRPLQPPADVARPQLGTLVKHVALRADGRYDVLVAFGEGLYLDGFEADGTARYRTRIHGDVSDWELPSLVTRDDGTMLITLDVRSDRRAKFTDAHGVRDPAGPGAGPVLVTIAESGAVLSVRETRVPASSAALTGNLTVASSQPSWFVSDWGLPQQMRVSQAPGDDAPRAIATPFRHRLDSLDSMAVVGDDLYVAGLLDKRYGYKTMLGGRAYLGRFDREGALHFACADAPGPRDPNDSRHPLSSLKVHPTQIPLISARTKAPNIDAMWLDRTAMYALRVYLMEEPEEPVER